jgi:hypothetical protein
MYALKLDLWVKEILLKKYAALIKRTTRDPRYGPKASKAWTESRAEMLIEIFGDR